jgi:hypothetical protein
MREVAQIKEATPRDTGSEMKQGTLGQYFKGVAVKRLSAVETDPKRSNQHEFNGRNVFRDLLGLERRSFEARFIYLGDEQEGFSETSKVSWYDSRQKVAHRSAEYRLYYRKNAVIQTAKEGDALFVALRTDNTIMFVVTPAGSTIESQLLWLFGLPDQRELKFAAHEITKSDGDKLDFAVRYIFDELGIEPEESEVDILDAALERFGKKFPSMAVFSAMARETLPDISPLDDADEVLLAWMDREELLFRRLERHIVAERIQNGFMAGADADVDGFLKFSLSVQNRRKARAGAALEDHLECIFKARSLRFGRGCETENKNKPDFLFPSCKFYKDASFPDGGLTMLGAKASLKDRWRQVLSEAQRIHTKHLLTLSPGLSVNQTDEMQSKRLQLVVPTKLHRSYQASQQKWLIDLRQFIDVVSSRQKLLDA